jgi:hypothetical protein
VSARFITVSAELRAYHTDLVLDEGRHEHCWKVTLFFKADPFRDARSLRASLAQVLEGFQGKDLPDALWRTEDLAEAIARLHGNADCQGARLERPDGCGAEVWL